MSRLRRSLPLSMIVALVLALALPAFAQAQAPTARPAKSWKYTALGDSLATGILSWSGYVPRYRDYMQTDTRVSVSSVNHGQNGWTSGQLLSALRTNRTLRNDVSSSQAVTWDIGGNDWIDARDLYRAGACGGSDNQDCLRLTISSFKANWDAIIVEILALRTTSNTIIRTMDIYNPYINEDRAADSWSDDNGDGHPDATKDSVVFQPYIVEANAHIRTTAASNSIPYAPVYAAFNGSEDVSLATDPSDKGYIAFDGLHPNDTGHSVIAGLLRDLRYAPLK